MSGIGIIVAGAAHGQGLAGTSDHHLDPSGLDALPERLEVFQHSDMMHLHVLQGPKATRDWNLVIGLDGLFLGDGLPGHAPTKGGAPWG